MAKGGRIVSAARPAVAAAVQLPAIYPPTRLSEAGKMRSFLVHCFAQRCGIEFLFLLRQ
jgi:hypothetical protein